MFICYNCLFNFVLKRNHREVSKVIVIYIFIAVLSTIVIVTASTVQIHSIKRRTGGNGNSRIISLYNIHSTHIYIRASTIYVVATHENRRKCFVENESDDIQIATVFGMQWLRLLFSVFTVLASDVIATQGGTRFDCGSKEKKKNTRTRRHTCTIICTRKYIICIFLIFLYTREGRGRLMLNTS